MSNLSKEQAFTCPRRIADGLADDNSPFALAGRFRDAWSGDRVCSYCGSLDPDELMRRLEAGDVRLSPTDKRYKVYVEGGDLPRTMKFYFQHFSREQQARFIELHNEKRLRLAFPGHFYVLPFFCSAPPEGN